MNQARQNLKKTMKYPVNEVVGFKEKMVRSNHYSSTTEKLSQEQKKYKMQNKQTKEVDKVKEIRNKRNQTLTKRVKNRTETNRQNTKHDTKTKPICGHV